MAKRPCRKSLTSIFTSSPGISGTGLGCDSALPTTTHDGRPSALGQAFSEYGRIAKTMHLLAYVDLDDSYRRQIGAQLNIQESRHQLARRIFHGQRNELRQRYREGQEDRLGALGLVLNAVVLWNTRYMDLALAQLRRLGGGGISEQD